MSSVRAAFICTGNRFRSPLAAAVFARELAARGLGAEIESFGVLDVAGAPALGEAVELGLTFDVDLAAHRARPLASSSLRDFDLVVGFERFHLAAAVVDGGARREATYTLPEIVELLASATGDDMLARIAVASTRRNVGKTFSGVPEIDDPLGRPLHAQRRIAASVVQLTRELAQRLFPL